MSRSTFEPGPGHPDYEPTQEELDTLAAAAADEEAENAAAADDESGTAAEGETD